MESIIAVDMKSYLFSNNLISDQQFRFTTGHSALDMLLLLTQNGWRPSISDMRWADWLDTSRAFDTLWHPALLSKLSAKDIQGQLHTWLTDFFSSRSQHMALTRIPSSPLPVKAGAPKCGILFIVLFLIFISDLSDSLGNPFYQFLDDSILCRDIPHPSNRQVWKKSQAGQTLGK